MINGEDISYSVFDVLREKFKGCIISHYRWATKVMWLNAVNFQKLIYFIQHHIFLIILMLLSYKIFSKLKSISIKHSNSFLITYNHSSTGSFFTKIWSAGGSFVAIGTNPFLELFQPQLRGFTVFPFHYCICK